MVLITVGALLVALAVLEVAITVLHPEARGPVTARMQEAMWRLLQVAHRRSRFNLSKLGGPMALFVGVGSWVVMIWFGFGLIWLGASSEVEAASKGLFDPGFGLIDALYFSGAVLTTTGFGDLVASGDATRLLAVVEGAVGLGVLSALISYTLALYPLVREKRVIASRLLDLEADTPEGALQLTYRRGWIALDHLHSQLIEMNQSLRRFHVLYYFHASRYEEELTPLVRATHLAHISLLMRSDSPEVGDIAAYARPLGRACERFRESTTADFRIPEGEGSDRERCGAALAELHAHARERWPEMVAPELDADPILEVIDQAERYLAGLASVQCCEFRPLLSLEEPDRRID